MSVILKANKICVNYGKTPALHNVSFEINQGDYIGLAGPNGAGKTTAIKILCGLSSPTSGEISVAGFDAYHETEKIKKNIGYMSQKFSLYSDLTVKENIRFYGGIYGLSRDTIKRKTKDLLEKLNFSEHAGSLISSIPLGWKQKLAFSIAVFHEPKIVFLDEPTGGVDPITRRQFWDLIYETAHTGITVFVTTHYMDEAEYCNRVCIMVDGRIDALDTPENLKKQFGADNMDEVFVRLARAEKK